MDASWNKMIKSSIIRLPGIILVIIKTIMKGYHTPFGFSCFISTMKNILTKDKYKYKTT